VRDTYLAAIRALAWAVALGAVAAVAARYDKLPYELPLTRWTMAAKSPLVALRVPLINVLTLGLVELLSRALRRASETPETRAALVALFLTTAAKSAIEAAGLLLLPRWFAWTLVPLGVVLIAGLATAVYFGREWLRPQRWKELRMTRGEGAAGLAIVSGIVLLNLPIVVW
jgi:hypothetical protein